MGTDLPLMVVNATGTCLYGIFVALTLLHKLSVLRGGRLLPRRGRVRVEVVVVGKLFDWPWDLWSSCFAAG